MEVATDMVGALARIDTDYWANHPSITLRLTYAKMKQKTRSKVHRFCGRTEETGRMLQPYHQLFLKL